MTESQLTTKIKNFIKSKGAYVEKIFGGGFQASGVPDLICCYKGLFIAIEVKSPSGKGRASDVQKVKIRHIRESGGIALINDCFHEVEELFKNIDCENKIKYNDKYVDKKQKK